MNMQAAPAPLKKSRGRPEQISLSQVIRALGPQPRSATPIAQSLQVSRATLHRKLSTLIDQGLVIATGQGRACSYRLPTAFEQIEAMRAEVARQEASSQGFRCRLVLASKRAYQFMEDIDLAMRIGIGQFEIVNESIRDRAFGPDPIADGRALERLGSVCSSIKIDLLGMPSNASHGIYSPHVDDKFRVMRSVLGAVRHRMAWDRNPEGSMGVHHDEPMDKLDLNKSVVVYSCASTDVAGERLIVVEASAAVLLVVADGLKLARRINDGDFVALTDLARDGLLKRFEGAKITADHIALAKQTANIMKAVWAGEAAQWTHARCDLESGRSRNQHTLISVIRCAAGAEAADLNAGAESAQGINCHRLNGDEPMFGVEMKELPEGFFINRSGHLYRVIGPSDSPDHLRIYGESASVQTAVMMANNAINGGRSRAVGF